MKTKIKKKLNLTNATTYLAVTQPVKRKKNILIERLMGLRKHVLGTSAKSGKHATQKVANGAFGK